MWTWKCHKHYFFAFLQNLHGWHGDGTCCNVCVLERVGVTLDIIITDFYIIYKPGLSW